MARTFDSGALYPARRLVRQQIAARLDDLLRASGGYLGSVVELPAWFTAGDPDLQAMLVSGLSQPPAVLIALGARSFRAAGMGDASMWRSELEIQVLLADRVNRTELDTVRGDVTSDDDATTPPGIETMSDHVLERLAGARLRTAIGDVLPAANAAELRPVNEREVWFGDGWIVWEHLYTVQIEVDINRQRAVSARLLSIRTNNTLDDATAVNPITPTVTEIAAS